MKRILIAGAIALAAGGQALAADLPPGPPPSRAPATYVPVAVPYYNWGGIYIGVNGGYDYGRTDWTAAGGTTGTFNAPGFLVGGTLGANFQAGAFVFGVEGDLDYSRLSGSTTCGPAPGVSCQTSENYLGTARLRAGYAWDRVLFYATGGGAFGSITATTPLGSNSNNEFGWTAGAGIEYAFAQNWTAKVEYLYVSLQNGSCSTVVCAGVSPGLSPSVSLNENIARAGINYKFNF